LSHHISHATWEIVFTIGFPPAIRTSQVVFVVEDSVPACRTWTQTAAPDELAVLCEGMRSGTLLYWSGLPGDLLACP